MKDEDEEIGPKIKIHVVNLGNTKGGTGMNMINVVQEFLVEAINGGEHTEKAWDMFAFGFVAKTICGIDDDKWEEIKREAVKPCRRNGCTCHLMHAAMIEGFDKVRRYFGTEKDKRKATGRN